MFGKKKDNSPARSKAEVLAANENFLSMMRIKNIEQVFEKLKTKDEYQRTPLHRAIECEVDSKWIDLMLNNGADPNAQDDNGNTPLHYAAQNGDIATVTCLLNHKANPHLLNHYKKNPICDINALQAKHPLALYELLLKHQSQGCFWEKDSYVSDAFHKALIQLAVKYYSPQHIAFDSQKNSLLHWACYYGLEEEVEMLIKQGCRLFAKNAQNKTGLMIAVEKQFFTIKGILERAMKK